MIRPSSLGRLERCPGSARLEDNAPDRERNEPETETAAGRGTRLHEIASNALLRPAQKLEYLARCEDEDEIKIIEAYLSEGRRVWDSLTPEQRARAEVRVEKMIDLEPIGIERGTPDLVVIVRPTETDDGLIIVRDLKTGMGWVAPARWNLQIMAYAAGSVESVENYRADIGLVQPMRREIPDTWVASKGDLQSVKDRVRHVVENAKKTDAPLQSGPWCDYCKAINNCPARALVAAEVKAIANPVEVITSLEGAARTALYIKIAEAVKVLTLAKAQIDEAILSSSLQIDGFEIGDGKKGRFWRKPNSETIEALTEIATERGFTRDDICEAISVGKAEKLLGKSNIPENMVATKAGNPTIKRSK